MPLPVTDTPEQVDDGGVWEKPEWARPDNEIKIHRGPDQQDDKIVIPPEQ